MLLLDDSFCYYLIVQNIKPKYIYVILSVLFVLIALGFVVANNSDKLTFFGSQKSKLTPEQETKNFIDMYNPKSENVRPGSLSDVIKNEISRKFDRDYSEITITSVQEDGKFSRAVVDSKNIEAGLVTVLLTYKDNKWVLIYSGSDKIPCSVVEKESFSTGMVPVCIDDTGNFKSRISE